MNQISSPKLMENIKTAEDVLKSKLDPKIIILNNSDYTFNKVIEAMEEYASLQSSKDKERIIEIVAAYTMSKDLTVDEAKQEFPRRFSHQCEVARKWIKFETLSGEPVVSKDKEEIERLKQRIAELEKALKSSRDYISVQIEQYLRTRLSNPL